MFMFEEKLEVAYRCSDQVLKQLTQNEKQEAISTQRLIEIVEQLVHCRIVVASCDFESIQKSIKDCGAMMLTQNKNGKRTARIVLNDSKDKEFQRFSLVHELGHLMAEKDNLFEIENDGYKVSTHVDYSVTSIPKEEYENNDFLLNEQRANIFALRTLMPWDSFYKVIDKFDSFSEAADYFRMPKQAIISRIMLVR